MSNDRTFRAIADKLSQLKRLDPRFRLFGADSHRYVLNGRASAADIDAFETRHRIELPGGYADFLTRMGNGGAGPYYGLQPLGESLYVDLDARDRTCLLDPSQPFPLTHAWNMEFTGDEADEEAHAAFEREYFADTWTHGLLRICNFGCGVSLNLVVNGPEHGNIWVDDRGNDGGIYPDPYFDQDGRTTFLEWYELWLDRSIGEMKSG